VGHLTEFFICDGCGTPKRDVNHWWSIILRKSLLNNLTGSIVTDVVNESDVVTSDDLRQISSFLVVPFQQEYAKLDGVKCVCGQQCALKFLNTYMSEQIDELNGTVNPDFYVSDLI
jgi:hypothetical protein